MIYVIHKKLLGIEDLNLTEPIVTQRANQTMNFRVRDITSGTTDDPTAGSTVNTIRYKKPRDMELRDKVTIT